MQNYNFCMDIHKERKKVFLIHIFHLHMHNLDLLHQKNGSLQFLQEELIDITQKYYLYKCILCSHDPLYIWNKVKDISSIRLKTHVNNNHLYNHIQELNFCFMHPIHKLYNKLLS